MVESTIRTLFFALFTFTGVVDMAANCEKKFANIFALQLGDFFCTVPMKFQIYMQTETRKLLGNFIRKIVCICFELNLYPHTASLYTQHARFVMTHL